MDNLHHLHRRDFIKKSALATADLGLGISSTSEAFSPVKPKNKLPKWRGFNLLDFLDENGIGFGIWEFSGSFGVMNSGRADVDYEDWYGQKLDRKMLNLLTKYV